MPAAMSAALSRCSCSFTFCRSAAQARRPHRSSMASFRRPQAEAADERTRIVTATSARRKFLEQCRVSAADHDVFGFERGNEPFNDIVHVFAPLLFAELHEPA